MHRSVMRTLLGLLAASLLSSAANAQLFRAYVSSEGSDSNACTLVAPCRLLPAALNAIVDGGEIWMLDSANYNTGPVNVTKSASILAVPGVVGSVVALGGVAISINTAGVKVGLRNLVIVPYPASGGTDGVYIANASAVTIEETLIANLAGNAVTAIGNSAKIRIANSVMRNNTGYAVEALNGPAVDIADTKMLGNIAGAVHAYGNASGTTAVSVSDSLISGGIEGVFVECTHVSAVVRGSVTRSTIEHASYALDSETSGVGSAILSASNNMIASNLYGMFQAGTGSVLKSLGNNHVTDNITLDVFGTVTPVAPR